VNGVRYASTRTMYLFCARNSSGEERVMAEETVERRNA
jgi:hypothetical protein